MHIPDGYMSPLFTLGTGLITVPAWGIAARRVQSVLNNRTVPLLAIFSAFAFAIMMFNIPVPGGTTAHGVGGTLIAIVLGPWAAIIGVSMALIIQALFFGDGGILAIFTNCLNMGILLPFVGYWTYRAIAGRSPILSQRRVWAAGIGSYVGITISALAVGIELGVQPILFNDGGRPLYSPYGLEAAIPAMLIAHILGASLVEALITSLGLAYLQRQYPEYLTSAKLLNIVSGPGVEVGQTDRRPIWQVAATLIGGVLLLMIVGGLITGGGDPAHMFGADWSQVDWNSVAAMLLVTLVIGAILIPLAYFILPRNIKRVGVFFTTLAVLAPLGLIAPGFAYGEGSAEDVQAAFGYVPSGLQNLSTVFSAPLSGYNVPLPFFSDANSALWQTAIGYELSGIVGFLLLGLLTLGFAAILRRWGSAEASENAALDRAHGHSHGKNVGWLEHTVAGIAGSIERAVFTEEHARKSGWLQKLDPRAKLLMFVALVLAAGLSNSLLILVPLYLVVVLAAGASKVPFDFFVKRVWLGIPFFAGIIILPSLFFSGPPYLFDIALGSFHLAVSLPGVMGALVFVARVGVSVSLAVLLVLTTPWADLLKSLQALRVPQVFILLLSMTYRYIFLFLHSANNMLEARKSRMVVRATGAESRRWISAAMMSQLNRSFRMSSDVYAAMLARGFTGAIRTYSAYNMTQKDYIALAASVTLAVVALLAGRLIA